MPATRTWPRSSYASSRRKAAVGSPLDQITFHGEPWDVLERFEVRFEILPLEADLDFDQMAHRLARELGGPNSEFCDNLTSVLTLQRHLPLEAAGGIELDFERNG